ncbi:MAG: hypothetical protein EA406_02735 [Rhodospirillales bacterium]|nr:MAG: hypothetical protein EA406_02735 [Rhodospirillales bacterium]
MPDDARPIVSAAAEGDVDKAVLLRIADHVGVRLDPIHGLNGKDALLRNLRGYNNAARFGPWIVLVDLDRGWSCAALLVREKLPDPAPQMCFRVAVRAVEAWLLADRERVAAWLGVSIARVPVIPDAEADPKLALVDLARRSRRRRLKDSLVPRPGSSRSQGPLYTDEVRAFIQNRANGWRPDHAARASDSLARCIRALRLFRETNT